MAHEYDTTDTTQAQALDIEAMKADRQAGTPGPWQPQPDICHFYTVSDVIGGAHNQKKMPPQALHISVRGFNDWESKEADTRRIACVPDMEARIIRDQAVIAAANKLIAILINPVRSDDGYYDYLQYEIDGALAAYTAQHARRF